MAGLYTNINPTLIQSGEEKGFGEPLMKYEIIRLDSLSFRNYQKVVINSKKFKAGYYYLDIELDDYLSNNKLEILNMEYSMFTEYADGKTYYVYFLSDRRTIVICQINP